MPRTKAAVRTIAEGRSAVEHGRPPLLNLGVAELTTLSHRFVGACVPYGIEAGPSADGLPDVLERLVHAARAAARSSYSPYSKYRVGAAVSAGGKLYTGCNIENSSYGLTMCAERVAIFAAIADGNRKIEALAVSCIDAKSADLPNTRMPCGACRQVIEEFFGEDSPVFVDDIGILYKSELLPSPFILRL